MFQAMIMGYEVDMPSNFEISCEIFSRNFQNDST